MIRASILCRNLPGPVAHSSLRARRMALIGMCVAAAIAAVALATPGLASASTVTPRIDLKVLVLGTSTSATTDPDAVAWQAALQREGVPSDFVTVSASTSFTASNFATTAPDGTTPEGKYQAIIESGAALSTLSQASKDAMEQYQKEFNVRRVTSDVYPGGAAGDAGFGLKLYASAGALDGQVGQLTTTGKTIFPYLNGSVKMDTGTYGYEATPVSTTNFNSLVTLNGYSLVGIYTHADGVQELITTFNENQNQMQAWLLRHGVIAWATRGVYFGAERNYLSTTVDDMFNNDEIWNPTANNNTGTPAATSTSDITSAAAWSAANKFRIDFAFNGGGANNATGFVSQFKAIDPATNQPYANSFGWINHTYDHPNLDDGCATQNLIQNEISQNLSWVQTNLGLVSSTAPPSTAGYINPSELVTGEHSGLANLIPGNPGTLDSPDAPTVTGSATGGTLPAGTYEYVVAAQFTNSSSAGQSPSTISGQVLLAGTASSATLTWPAVCHAADYVVYRGFVTGTAPNTTVTWTALPAYAPTSWTVPGTTTTATTAFGDTGANDVTFPDPGSTPNATTSATLPTSDTAVEGPYDQNPNLVNAFAAPGIGIKAFGSDASKPYPNPANQVFAPEPAGTTYASATTPAGATFTDGGAQAVPRYPTNIYYNVSTAAEEVSEYNYIYLPPHCVNTATNTCLTTGVTDVSQIYASVDQNMFSHMMGNDPRPHYFHQTNLIGGSSTGLFYGTINPLLSEYSTYFNAATAPIEQPTMSQAASLLANQSSWAANTTVSGYIQGNQVTLTNTGSAANVPMSGIVGVGSSYGGTQSGWSTVSAGTSKYTSQITWPDARTLTVQLTPSSIVANGSSTSTAKVTVTDEGFPVTGDTVTLASSDAASPDKVKIGLLTDNKDGTYTATITSSSTPGPVTITATDTLTPANVTPVMNLTAQATLNLTTGSAAHVGVTLSPSSILANGSSTSTATARITDIQNRPLATEPQVSFASSDSGEKISPVTNNGDGTYSATITSSTTVGAPMITAKDSTNSPSASGQATLTQTAGPATSVHVIVSPSSIVANGTSTSTATATVADAQGHRLAGDLLSFASSDAGEKIGPVRDNHDGTYSATVTSSSTPGPVTITATDSSVPAGVSGKAVLTQTAKPVPPLDRVAPIVGVAGASLVKSGQTSAVTLTCPKGQSYCDGTVTLATTKGVLGSGHFHIAGNRSATVTVTLSKVMLRKLGKAVSVEVMVGVSAKDRAGLHGTASKQRKLWLILDATKPTMGIGAGRLTLRNGTVKMKLTCPDGQTYCDGTVTLSTGAGKHRVVLGKSHFHLARNSTGTVAITLSKSTIRKLGTFTNLHVTVDVTARDKAGRAGKAHRTAALNASV